MNNICGRGSPTSSPSKSLLPTAIGPADAVIFTAIGAAVCAAKYTSTSETSGANIDVPVNKRARLHHCIHIRWWSRHHKMSGRTSVFITAFLGVAAFSTAFAGTRGFDFDGHSITTWKRFKINSAGISATIGTAIGIVIVTTGAAVLANINTVIEATICTASTDTVSVAAGAAIGAATDTAICIVDGASVLCVRWRPYHRMHERTRGLITPIAGARGFGISFTYTGGLMIAFAVARGFAVVSVCVVSLTLAFVIACAFAIVSICTRPCHCMCGRTDCITIAHAIPLQHPTSMLTPSLKNKKPFYLKQVQRVPTSDIYDERYLHASNPAIAYHHYHRKCCCISNVGVLPADG